MLCIYPFSKQKFSTNIFTVFNSRVMAREGHVTLVKGTGRARIIIVRKTRRSWKGNIETNLREFDVFLTVDHIVALFQLPT